MQKKTMRGFPHPLGGTPVDPSGSSRNFLKPSLLRRVRAMFRGCDLLE